MTATEPTARPHTQPDGPQHAEIAPVADTYLDYAARNYEALATQPPPMPTDVLIAATIGLGDEMRTSNASISGLTIAVDRLAAAIERLEKLLADPTAVLRAAQAEAQQPLFGLDEAEAAVEQLPVSVPS